MWRNLLIRFERNLVIVPRKYLNTNFPQLNSIGYVSSITNSRHLATTRPLYNKSLEKQSEKENSNYVAHYEMDKEKGTFIEKYIIDQLRKRFTLTEEDIERILQNPDMGNLFKRRAHIFQTLDTLIEAGLKKETFIEYPAIIKHKNTITEKIRLIKSINGLREFNDFVPFLCVPIPRLRQIVAKLNADYDRIDHGNRINYIAETLHVPALLVTSYLAKRLFVLDMSLCTFKAKLQLMLKYKVEPISLLKDLWAFRYKPRYVESRLKRAYQAKREKIMPWMVRCPEDILEKSLKLTTDEQEVLGDKSSVAEYIGDRLGFSPEEAQVIMNKHPSVNKVRVTKIKEVLDYLLFEEKFLPFEIAQNPRILCHSLKTTRERIEELKKYNCRPSSLVIVCRSQREYQKFLDKWCENNVKLKINNNIEKVKDNNNDNKENEK